MSSHPLPPYHLIALSLIFSFHPVITSSVILFSLPISLDTHTKLFLLLQTFLLLLTLSNFFFSNLFPSLRCSVPSTSTAILFCLQLRSGETAAIVARELAEQTKGLLRPGDVPSTVRAMAQLVELLDVQLRNLTPGGKDSAARSLTKVLLPTEAEIHKEWESET